MFFSFAQCFFFCAVTNPMGLLYFGTANGFVCVLQISKLCRRILRRRCVFEKLTRANYNTTIKKGFSTHDKFNQNE
jgi:hypothetical protein